MNLILHLLRNDLRHFRFATLFWASIVVAQAILTHRLLAMEYGDWRMIACGFVILLQILGMFMAYLLSGLIVLADAPAGSVSHWQTRPISGVRLLAAKGATGLLLFGVLAVALWLPWWLAWGFGATSIAQAAVNVLLAGIVPAVLGAALAAMVDQIGRFLLLTAVLVAGLVVFVLTSLIPPVVPAGLFGTRLVVGLAILIGAAVVATVIQYRTREVRLSAPVLAAGLAVLLAVRAWWPVDLAPWWVTSRTAYAGTQPITARIGEWVHIGKGSAAAVRESYRLVLFVNFEDVPDEVFVAGGYADVELRWADGTRIHHENVRFKEDPERVPEPALRRALDFSRQEFWVRPKHWDPETEAWSEHERARQESRMLPLKVHRAPVPEAVPGPPVKYSLRCDVPLSVDEAARVRAQPPACRITARVALKRLVVVAESPLTAGTILRHDGRAELLHLEQKELPAIDAKRLRTRYAGTISVVHSPYGARRLFFLVDRGHETIHYPAFPNGAMGTPPLAAAVVAYPFMFMPPTLWRGDRWVEMPGWKNAYTLVEVEPQSVGTFGWSGGVDRLTITAAAGPE